MPVLAVTFSSLLLVCPEIAQMFAAFTQMICFFWRAMRIAETVAQPIYADARHIYLIRDVRVPITLIARC